MAETTTLTFTMLDAEDATFNIVLHYDAADFPDIETATETAHAMEVILNDISGCIVSEMRVGFTIARSEPAEVPDQGYYIRSGATMGFKDSDGKPTTFYVPGILMANIINKKVVNADATGIVALRNAVTGATSGVEPVSTQYSASQWTTWRKGWASSRKGV